MTMPHAHHHHHGHEHGADAADERTHPYARPLRYGAAVLVLAAAVLSACLVLVDAGEAVVVTRFGDPVRVLTQPGLAWKLPAPIDSTTNVDLRLRTTSMKLAQLLPRSAPDGPGVCSRPSQVWYLPESSLHTAM